MPTGTCDPASRGQTYNEMALEYPAPDGSGGVLVDARYGWVGVWVRPDCNGPITFLRTRNTSGMTAWVNLPNKKKPPLWVQIDPGTDTTITAAGQLRNLGLESAVDVRGVQIPVFEQPV
jgi:hypothetical protein